MAEAGRPAHQQGDQHPDRHQPLRRDPGRRGDARRGGVHLHIPDDVGHRRHRRQEGDDRVQLGGPAHQPPQQEGAEQRAVAVAGDGQRGQVDVAGAGAEAAGEDRHQRRPQQRGPPPQPQHRRLGGPVAGQAVDDVGDRGVRHRVERRGERAHRGPQDARHQQPGDPDRQPVEDEARVEVVGALQPQLLEGPPPVVRPQQRPHQGERRELHGDEDSRADHRLLTVPQGAAGQHPLDDQLVGTVAGHGEDRAAEDCRRQGEGAGQHVGGGEVGVEDPEVPGVQRGGEAVPADMPAEDADRQQRPARVQAHLDHVGPDHRLDAAEVGVADGDHGQHDDDQLVADVQAELVQQQLDRDRRGEEPDALGEQPGEDEGDRGDPLQPRPEPLRQVLVGADEVAPLVERDQHGRHHDPPDDVAQCQLDVAEGLAAGGPAGDADHGQHAGLGRHHREAHRPPRHPPLADEVVGGGLLAPRETQPDPGDDDEVHHDHDQVDAAHRLTPRRRIRTWHGHPGPRRVPQRTGTDRLRTRPRRRPRAAARGAGSARPPRGGIGRLSVPSGCIGAWTISSPARPRGPASSSAKRPTRSSPSSSAIPAAPRACGTTSGGRSPPWSTSAAGRWSCSAPAGASRRCTSSPPRCCAGAAPGRR